MTAVIAIINLVLFQIPGVTYYQTTSEVLGKLYSNTMMVNLVNSRMVYDITDTVSNRLSTDHRRPVSTAHVGISVMREEWRMDRWRMFVSWTWRSASTWSFGHEALLEWYKRIDYVLVLLEYASTMFKYYIYNEPEVRKSRTCSTTTGN